LPGENQFNPRNREDCQYGDDAEGCDEAAEAAVMAELSFVFAKGERSQREPEAIKCC